MTNQDYLRRLQAIRNEWKLLFDAGEFAQALNFLNSQRETFLGSSKIENEIQGYLAFCQGYTYEQLGHHETAVKSLEESYQLDPQDSVLVSKAMTLWTLGKREEAKVVVASIQEPIFSDYANAWLEKHEGDESS